MLYFVMQILTQAVDGSWPMLYYAALCCHVGEEGRQMSEPGALECQKPRTRQIISVDRARLSGKPPRVVLKGCTTWRFRTTDVNDLLDIGEAARFLNVSVTSLRRWTNAGVLECLRIGKRRERRFRRAALLAFMEQPAVAQRSAGATGRSPSTRDSAAERLTVSHGSHLCAIYGSE